MMCDHILYNDFFKYTIYVNKVILVICIYFDFGEKKNKITYEIIDFLVPIKYYQIF